MGRGVIAPAVGFLVMVLKVCFGIEVPEELANGVIDWGVNGVSLALIGYGIYHNYKKQKTTE